MSDQKQERNQDLYPFTTPRVTSKAKLHPLWPIFGVVTVVCALGFGAGYIKGMQAETVMIQCERPQNSADSLVNYLYDKVIDNSDTPPLPFYKEGMKAGIRICN